MGEIPQYNFPETYAERLHAVTGLPVLETFQDLPVSERMRMLVVLIEMTRKMLAVQHLTLNLEGGIDTYLIRELSGDSIQVTCLARNGETVFEPGIFTKDSLEFYSDNQLGEQIYAAVLQKFAKTLRNIQVNLEGRSGLRAVLKRPVLVHRDQGDGEIGVASLNEYGIDLVELVTLARTNISDQDLEVVVVNLVGQFVDSEIPEKFDMERMFKIFAALSIIIILNSINQSTNGPILLSKIYDLTSIWLLWEAIFHNHKGKMKEVQSSILDIAREYVERHLKSESQRGQDVRPAVARLEPANVRQVTPEDVLVIDSLTNLEKTRQFDALLKVFSILEAIGQSELHFSHMGNKQVVWFLRTNFTLSRQSDDQILVAGAIGGDFTLNRNNLNLIGQSFFHILQEVNTRLKSIIAASEPVEAEAPVLFSEIPVQELQRLAQKNISPRDFAAVIATMIHQEFEMDDHKVSTGVRSMLWMVGMLGVGISILALVENPSDRVSVIYGTILFFGWLTLAVNHFDVERVAKEKQREIMAAVQHAYPETESEDEENDWRQWMLNCIRMIAEKSKNFLSIPNYDITS